jgi:putative nucleotidyltransferase with HDIG domain
MKKYALPTHKQCLRMLKEHRVPSHIVRHSLTVAKLAVFLSERLKEKGLPVDVALVDRACLLHDIFRICELEKTEAHEDAAYNLLKEKYPVLALTVKKHRYSALLDEKERPRTWEEKLVYYADKRVMHDRIVPLKERLEEAHKRYAGLRRANVKPTLDTTKIDGLIYKLEKEIFTKISLDPLDVTADLVRPGRGEL